MIKINKLLKYSIVTFSCYLLLTTSVFAASQFGSEANQYLDKACNKSNVKGGDAVLCNFQERIEALESIQAPDYLDRIVSLETLTTNLQNSIINIDQTLGSLTSSVQSIVTKQVSNDTALTQHDTRISALETAGGNKAEEIVALPYGRLTHGQESSVIDAQGHQIIILNAIWGSGTCGFHLYGSDDGLVWEDQADIAGSSNLGRDELITIVKYRYYKVAVVNTADKAAVILILD